MVERVPLVEGDELLGVLFALALSEAGCVVTRVSGGAEACLRWRPRRPQHAPLGELLLKPFPVGRLVGMAGALLATRAEGARVRRSA